MRLGAGRVRAALAQSSNYLLGSRGLRSERRRFVPDHGCQGSPVRGAEMTHTRFCGEPKLVRARHAGVLASGRSFHRRVLNRTRRPNNCPQHGRRAWPSPDARLRPVARHMSGYDKQRVRCSCPLNAEENPWPTAASHDRIRLNWLSARDATSSNCLAWRIGTWEECGCIWGTV